MLFRSGDKEDDYSISKVDNELSNSIARITLAKLAGKNSLQQAKRRMNDENSENRTHKLGAKR